MSDERYRRHPVSRRSCLLFLFFACVSALQAQLDDHGQIEGYVVVVPRSPKLPDPATGTVEATNELSNALHPSPIGKDHIFRDTLVQGYWSFKVKLQIPPANYVQVPANYRVFIRPNRVNKLQNLELNSAGRGLSAPANRARAPGQKVILVVYVREPSPRAQQPVQTCPAVTGTGRILREDSKTPEDSKIPAKGLRVTISPQGAPAPAYDAYTDEQGRFSVPEGRLQPETDYTVTASQRGYYTVTLPATCTNIPQLLLMTEDIGTDLSLMQTEEPDRTLFLTGDIITALPLERIRNFDSLALLAPGVLLAPVTAENRGPGIAPRFGTPGQYSINGARSRENNFQFDGSDDNDEEFGVRRQGFVSPAPESVESVTQFQVIASLADARYGRSIGGQVDALTRRGGRVYHGSLYGYLTDARVNARNYFNASPAAPAQSIILDGQPFTPPSPPSDADPFTRAQTGFNFAGPLIPLNTASSKTFVFLGFERQAIRSSVTNHFNLPNLDQRGVFNSGRTGYQLQASSLFPSFDIGDAIFSLFPFPNNPSGPYGANTFSERLSSDATGYLGSISLNRSLPLLLGSGFTIRYNRTWEHSELPSVEDAVASSLVPHLRTDNVATYFNTKIRSTLWSTFRFSFGLTSDHFDRALPSGYLQSTNYGADPYLLNAPLLLNVSQKQSPGSPPKYATATSQTALAALAALRSNLGSFPIPLDLTATEPITGALGQVDVDGFSPVGVDPYRFPQSRSDHTLQFADLATWVHGPHTLYFGFDVRRVVLDNTAERDSRPLAEFHGLPSIDGGLFSSPPPFYSASTLAAFGVASGVFQTLALGNRDSLSLHRTQTDAFLQYQGRVLPRLSISAGLRAEFYRLPKDASGQITEAFDVGQLTSAVQQVRQNTACNSACKLVAQSLEDAFPASFASTFEAHSLSVNPRLGFAWDLLGDDRTVVRGGIGLYTGQFPAVIVDESRSVFPSFLPLNFSSPFYENAPGFLLNLDNPSNPQINKKLLQTGSFNQIVASGSNTTQSAVNFVALQLSQYGFGQATFQQPGLQLTQPADALTNARSIQTALTLQRKLGTADAISAAYVGSLGRHLLRVSTPDLGPSEAAIYFQISSQYGGLFPFLNGFPVPAQTDAQGNPVIFPITRKIWEGTANSSFHSLQADWKHRYRSNLLFGAAFTYSHAIDDASDFFDTPSAPALPQDSLHRSERGSSSFDSRARVAAYFDWHLPLGHRRGLNGWQMSGIFTSQSGQPFTVISSIDVNADGNLTDRLNSTTGLLQGPVNGDRRIRLALAPGTDPASLLAQPGFDGRVGRNTFRSSGITQLNLAISDRLALSEKIGIILRFEAFNIANHPEFGIPVNVLEAAGFGSSVYTVAPARNLQAGLRVQF